MEFFHFKWLENVFLDEFLHLAHFEKLAEIVDYHKQLLGLHVKHILYLLDHPLLFFCELVDYHDEHITLF